MKFVVNRLYDTFHIDTHELFAKTWGLEYRWKTELISFHLKFFGTVYIELKLLIDQTCFGRAKIASIKYYQFIYLVQFTSLLKYVAFSIFSIIQRATESLLKNNEKLLDLNLKLKRQQEAHKNFVILKLHFTIYNLEHSVSHQHYQWSLNCSSYSF